ncbi:MAG: M50 family metallopeptidase [Janthinobacterium lividum]
MLVRNGFGLGWGIAIALGLLFAARRLSGKAAELTAMFLGVQCVVNSLYDLKTLVGLSTLPNGPISDAVLMSRIIPLPPLVWAVFWGLLSVGILVTSLRPYWRDARFSK